MRVISVHIPETAGGLFGEMLIRNFGPSICLHYYHLYDRNWNRIAEIPPHAEFLHGHFQARPFVETYPSAKLVTWLRDPAERVAAEFDHLKRNPDPNSELSQMITSGATLLDFAENPFARNTQVRYVDGLPLERFAFVGISENFVEEVKRFSSSTGIPLSFPTRGFKRFTISEEARQRLLELNSEDEQLYRAAGGQTAPDASRGRGEHQTAFAAGAEPQIAQTNVAPSSAEGRKAEDIEAGYFNRYVGHLNRLKSHLDTKAAFEAAVGGDFLRVGKLEFAILKKFGLDRTSDVIDVGCGSGRLALQLAPFSALSYLGTDVVPDLLEYARNLVRRPDWRFEVTDGIKIPSQDHSADIVTFFSVFTHITHEDCYRYLREAKRVIRPGGRILVSFLEFRILSHWEIFRQSLIHRQPGDPMNQFMDRDGLQAWARDLELRVVEIVDGDQPILRTEEEARWAGDHAAVGAGLGQSLAVLTKD